MIFLYGPPGSGKSTLGRRLAEELGCSFIDLDEQIVAAAGRGIPEIFTYDGEPCFRQYEKATLLNLLESPDQRIVVALGGGALLDPDNRSRVVAAGSILCLTASQEILAARLQVQEGDRPLLAGNLVEKLSSLLEQRAAHYSSFNCQIDTGKHDLEQSTREAQILTGWFHITGMGQPYDVFVTAGGRLGLGQFLRDRGLGGPVALVTDEQVGPLYGRQLLDGLQAAGYACQAVELPVGEKFKTIQTVNWLWECFLAMNLDRSSSVVALGGGVINDLVGFAAATYMRGLSWITVPTTLLAMCDASLGGKTAVDLARGKNLVGAFHSPAMVLADPDTLETLPEPELRSGMAEVVKHGLLDDPELFELCRRGWPALQADWRALVRRAMAVKVRIIQEDPYEKGRRAALNLGHTLGHALELASDYRLRHGEAVAIGLFAAAKIASWRGLAPADLAQELDEVLTGLGLPTRVPAGVDPARIMAALRLDKKRRGGQVLFVLPCQIGHVVTGQEVSEEWILRFLNLYQSPY